MLQQEGQSITIRKTALEITPRRDIEYGFKSVKTPACDYIEWEITDVIRPAYPEEDEAVQVPEHPLDGLCYDETCSGKATGLNMFCDLCTEDQEEHEKVKWDRVVLVSRTVTRKPISQASAAIPMDSVKLKRVKGSSTSEFFNQLLGVGIPDEQRRIVLMGEARHFLEGSWEWWDEQEEVGK